MTVLLLEVPHRGEPRAWTVADLEDYCARTYAAAQRADRSVWERKTPREMLDDGGYPSFDAPADPEADDPIWMEIRALAAEHSADTPLYRAGWITRDEWQAGEITEVEACDAYNGHDLSAFYRLESAEECRELLARLEGPNAPRIGLCGPVAAARALRREAEKEGWIESAPDALAAAFRAETESALPDAPAETELAFLEDLNALVSQALDGEVDHANALRTLADDIRERIGVLEGQA